MTQNEAKEYFLNKDNWHCIVANDYVRVYRLDYGECHYVCVAHKRIINVLWAHRDEAPETGFSRSNYYLFDTEHDCFGYNASQTEIIKAIWQESKK